VDFPHEYNSNKNPTLLVENTGRVAGKGKYTKVPYEQAATHLHHAKDFNIQLPSDFDMVTYKNLDQASRIKYAEKKLPRSAIIEYQNEMAKSMSPRFNEIWSVLGFAGIHKTETELVIQSTKTPKKYILSVVREDGLHISSYSISQLDLENMAKDEFWVWKNSTLNR
jgi:hypothetical protein